MTISLKHSFTSAKSDGGDNTLVQPSNWNAEHQLTLANNTVLGRNAGTDGAAQELTGSDLRALTGLATTDSPQFTALNVGHATDTTIARVSAGVISVEGSNVILANNKISALSATTSAELAGVISDETGSGALVFATTPTFVTSALFPAGAVGTPSIAASGDTNTGLWFPAADTIAASTGGSERMRIDSTGRIGINTTTPNSVGRLTVDGSIVLNSPSSFVWYGAGGGTDQKYWDVYSSNATGNSLNFRLLNDAYNAANTWLVVGRTGYETASIAFYTGASSERMRITSAGFVGINTTAPNVMLEANGGIIRSVAATGGSYVQIAGGTVDGATLGLYRAGSLSQAAFFSQYQGSLFIKNLDSGATIFTNTTSDTERMRITSAGNVGIGTTTATNILSLGGTAARTVWMERHTTANTAGNDLTVQSGGATSGATDKAGGNLVLSSGTATGTGSSLIRMLTAAAGAAGTADRAPAERFRVTSSGVEIANGSTGSTLEYLKAGYSITPWINVKTDYGATGNGSTDDTTAINNAIAAANASTYGAIIFFPPGTYKVTAALTAISKRGVVLQGSSVGSTTIARYRVSSNYDLITFAPSGVTIGTTTISATGELLGCGIRDLLLDDANYYSGATGGYQVVVLNTREFEINNLSSRDAYAGLYCRRNNTTILTNVVIDNVRGPYGIFMEQKEANGDASSDIFIYDNVTVTGFGSGGDAGRNTTCELLRLQGHVHSHYIKKLQLLRGGYGLVTARSGTGTTSASWPAFIVGSVLDIEYQYTQAASIPFLDGMYIQSLYCVQDSVRGTGMNFGGTTVTGQCTNIQIATGTVAGCQTYGLAFTNVPEVSITGITVEANAGTGISFNSGSSQIRVMGCYIVNNTSGGVDFGTATDCIAIGNIVKSNTSYQIGGSPTTTGNLT